MRCRRRGWGIALCLLSLLAWGTRAATPPRVPLKMQLALLTKIFAQDESLGDRNRIRIRVVYDPAVADSAWLKTEVTELARGATWAMGGRGVETDTAAVDSIKGGDTPDIYFLCALTNAEFQAVVREGRARGVRCFGSEPGDAQRGAAVSIGIAEGKPRILINRGAAVAQGAQFSDSLLKLADVS